MLNTVCPSVCVFAMSVCLAGVYCLAGKQTYEVLGVFIEDLTRYMKTLGEMYVFMWLAQCASTRLSESVGGHRTFKVFFNLKTRYCGLFYEETLLNCAVKFSSVAQLYSNSSEYAQAILFCFP